jgi:uncharacterized protein
MDEAPLVGPVTEDERIVSLDALRGVAVLGILVTNIQHFSMFAGTVRDPTLHGSLDGANFWVYALTFTLVYQKFLPIFAMLFGAGIVLAADRRGTAGRDPAPLHYRRMAVLLFIGMIHAYLIWYGDILVPYAVAGMVAFLFRRRSPGALIGLGIALLAASPVIRIVFFILPGMLGVGGGEGGPSLEQILADDLAAFRGPWIEQLRMRADYAFESQTVGLVVILFWRACGLMAIGMGLFKLGVLTGRRPARLYATLVLVALFVALPITALGLAACVTTEWKNFPLDRCRFWPCRSLAAVGRMALTNYLMQSVVCTFVFYGHGLGLYGSVERTGQIGIVVGLWILQLIGSSLWLRYFRFGPAEWFWRILTYGELQPIRVTAAGIESR